MLKVVSLENSKEEILLGTDFEQIVNVETDTTIYSFNKMIQLLTSNNPNTIEILGCKPEQSIAISFCRLSFRETFRVVRKTTSLSCNSPPKQFHRVASL